MCKIYTDICDSLITVYSQIKIDMLGIEYRIKHYLRQETTKKYNTLNGKLFRLRSWILLKTVTLLCHLREKFESLNQIVTKIIMVIFNKLNELLLIMKLNVKY